MFLIKKIVTLFGSWIKPDTKKPKYIIVSGVYYLISILFLLLIPYNPGIIPLLFIPVIYISIIYDIGESLLTNFVFLSLIFVYKFIGGNFNLGKPQIFLMSAGVIFSFVVIYLINNFTRNYKDKQAELTRSMEDLAASYRNLEATQTKLMALTWITKELLKIQDEDKLISKLIQLLNQFLLYKDVVYFCYKEGKFKIMDKSGFEDIDENKILDNINTDQTDISDEVELVEDIFDSEKTKLMYVYFYKRKNLHGLLAILHGTDWINEEDKYVMDILSDHINLILDNIKLIEDTHELAVTDSSTNLYNQRYFYKRLREIFNMSRKNNFSFSLVIFDIDNFKNLNDKYGHLTGDRVLEVFGRLMSENVRRNDVLARYGGDEFALLLPDSDQDVAYKISRRTVQIINEHDFMTEDGETINISISGGIVTYPDYKVNNAIELVKRADKALYESKRKGKNRVVLENEIA